MPCFLPLLHLRHDSAPQKCFKIDGDGNIFPTKRPKSCNTLVRVAPFYNTPPTEELCVLINDMDRWIAVSSRTIEQLARLIPRMKKMRWPEDE